VFVTGASLSCLSFGKSSLSAICDAGGTVAECIVGDIIPSTTAANEDFPTLGGMVAMCSTGGIAGGKGPGVINIRLSMQGGGEWLRKMLGAAGLPTSHACARVPEEIRDASPAASQTGPEKLTAVKFPKPGLSTIVASSGGATVTDELLDSEKWEM